MKQLLYIFLFTVSFNLTAQENLPSAKIKTLDGDITTLEEISKENDLIVVSLWATWCVPCKKELDAINDVYIDWQDETNVKVYAISVDDSRTVSKVKPLVNGKAWDFTILLDTNNDLKRELGASTVPLTLIIKNGKIVHRHSGYTPGSEDDLYEEIKKHS
ncbi:TlpA family protein disulfide reductase [Psychroserpens jangbogonensis]|uniref:TlpA family protein disulfide reductase n=1 Tax=Psychroserpens jangbogonensis TaxID=1484460 RepID=UPI00053E3C90|nr:TlpA disulfide reductase family protein [Psychroserpens jangbogonensis]